MEASRTPEEVLEELRAGYRRYLEEVVERRGSAIGDAFSNLLRPEGNPRVNELVNTFAHTLPAWVEELAGLLAGETPEEADRLAGEALELMLFAPPPADRSLELYVAAFEGHAAPLLPFLEPSHCIRLSERYRRRNPPRRMLPCQKKLWKAMTARRD